jgi:CHAT domain-containing protein
MQYRIRLDQQSRGRKNLGRAFQSAAALSVTVSLWDVSDNSTAQFMDEYYKALLSGDGKAEGACCRENDTISKQV